MSPRQVQEHQSGWKQHPAHHILFIPPSHFPSCFSCWGPPASPPPASESSWPAWDLPAKNKPHWGQEGGSKIPSMALLSSTPWLLGVLDYCRKMLHCASVSPPRATTALAGQEALGSKAGGDNCLISPGNGKQSLAQQWRREALGWDSSPASRQAALSQPQLPTEAGFSTHTEMFSCLQGSTCSPSCHTAPAPVWSGK